jgi:hypothetical protein
MVVGLCFMLLGGVLVLDKLGMLDAGEALQFWPIGLVLLGGSLMVQSMRAPVDGKRRTDFPFGGIVWLVLLGLFFTWTFERRSAADGGDTTNLFALMSDDQHIPQDAFHGGTMTSLMGGTTLDLRQAKLAPGQKAIVDVFALMGGAVIYAPKEWKIERHVTAVMGGVRDERYGEPEARRRRGGRGGRGGPEIDINIPDLPAIPDPPELPDLPGDAAAAPPEPDEDLDKVEREDPVPPLSADAPTLVIRGAVLMGGLAIKP